MGGVRLTEGALGGLKVEGSTAREAVYAFWGCVGSIRRKDWVWAAMYSGGRARDPFGSFG